MEGQIVLKFGKAYGFRNIQVNISFRSFYHSKSNNHDLFVYSACNDLIYLQFMYVSSQEHNQQLKT